MKNQSNILIGAGTICVLSLPLSAQQTVEPVQPQTDVQTPGNPSAETSVKEEQAPENADKITSSQAFVGLDLYGGRSTLPGLRRFSDGLWVGAGAVYPSAIVARWQNPKEQQAKLAIGVGSLYRNSDTVLNQPHEAWFQTPQGKNVLTVGKYYVPFAIQEWEYETKWGAMLQSSRGKTDLTASVNYDDIVRRPNLYTRAGYNFSERLSAGVSAGFGRGISFGTSQNRALGLDLTAKWRKVQFLSEYVDIRRRSSDRFSFLFGKISLENTGRFTPYLSRHTWSDRSENFGGFNTTTLGLTFQATPSLVLETAYAHTSQGNRSWLQLHWTPEIKVYDSAKKK